MNLQTSPIGVGVILVYSAVVLLLVAWPLWRLLRNWRRKWLFIVPLVLPLLAAPWAEEAWIAWRFEQACQDAGVHVYRTVKVEGYVDDLGRISRAGLKTGLLYFDPQSLADFDRRGYKFQENMLQDGGVLRLERRPEGIFAEILDRPTARYYFRFADPRQEVPLGWKLEKIETTVVDFQTGELLGKDTHFKRYPNMAEGLLLNMLGPAHTICEGTAPKPPNLRYPLYYYVLIPVKQ